MGADVGVESADRLDCKLGCGMPVPEEYDPSLCERGVMGLG